MMDDFVADFKERLKERKIKIAVVGLGYVGLPLAIEFAKKGFFVTGIDIDKDRISYFQKKKSYITDITDEEFRNVLSTGRLNAENNFSAIKNTEVVLICVPTPLKRKYYPDISFIKSAVKEIARNIKRTTLVILESTTYPGTTAEVIAPMLAENGLRHGRDFYLCFSPERIDPGNGRYPLRKIPKVIGGMSKESVYLGELLYSSIIKKVIPVSSTRVAETVKLLENTFRIVNIGLIDELAMMCHKMKINIWEVIDAAKTKPFGFMPFYPGPGVGGHCLDRNETLFIKSANSLKIMQMVDFIDYLQDNQGNAVEVLSFDPIVRRSVFKKVIAASVRPYAGQLISILTEDGRQIKVTDLHPMFVYNSKFWQLKYAKDLQKGDCLPICLKLPPLANSHRCDLAIDIIDEIAQRAQHLIDKIRVKPLGFSWKDYAKYIKHILRKDNNKIPDCCWDFLSDNVLPLKYFYLLNKLINIEHRTLKLVTGRGNSYSEVPAVIQLNTDFCRLIGYYLSEGCYTKDKSARIRFSFNRSEKEYIQDVVDILSRLGIRTSIYESKTWYTCCIKVSSDIFGFLMRDVLKCGTDSYTMNIPEQFFSLGKNNKFALLSGIFRGDACIEHFFGKWRYRKNEKEYFHNVNTAHIVFFTSSKRLFQQLIILLQDLNIVPTFGKRKYTISIFGYKQLVLLKDLFAGKKKEIIATYLRLNKNKPQNKNFKKFNNFALVKVKSILPAEGDWVYSIETAKPHTFVTSYGVVVHNCIPKDPLYLYWKAKKFGFKSRFIKLSSDMINYMPQYVVERLREILNKKLIGLNKTKILVIGVTYKKDVMDLRKSPALDIIEILEKEKASVSYYDPLIPYLKLNHINLKCIELNKNNLEGFDCALIATEHSQINYRFIAKYSKLIFDTRNVYKNITDNKKIITL